MRRTMLVLLAATMLVALPSAQALSAQRDTFTAQAFITSSCCAEVMERGEVLHVRGQIFELDVTGGLTGSLTVVMNFNFGGPAGVLWGSFSLEGSQTTWEGRGAGTIRDGRVHALTLVGHGGDGTKLMTTVTQTGEGEFELRGVILDPQG